MKPHRSQRDPAPVELSELLPGEEKRERVGPRREFLFRILGALLILGSLSLSERVVSLIVGKNLEYNFRRLEQLDSVRLILAETGIILVFLGPILSGVRRFHGTRLGHLLDFLPAKSMVIALCPLLVVLDLYWTVACVCDRVPFFLPMSLLALLQRAVISGSVILLLAFAVSRLTRARWVIALVVLPWAVLLPIETLIYYYGSGRFEARYFGLMTCNSVGGFVGIKQILFLIIGTSLCFWSGWLIAKETVKLTYARGRQLSVLLIVAWLTNVGFVSYWVQAQLSITSIGMTVLSRHYQHLKTIQIDPVWNFVAQVCCQNADYQRVSDWRAFRVPIDYYRLPLDEEEPVPLGQRPFKRVVLVLNESFSAFFVRSLNPKLPETMTPFLDSAVAQEHMLGNHRATNQPTREGVAATLCSHPNPYLVMQCGFPNSFPRILREHGWHTVYMNPVTGFFDDQSQKASDAGFKKVLCLEELAKFGSKPKHISKWGLCDHDLFQCATDYLNECRDKPVFMTIITCDTHGPLGREDYLDLTYPESPAWLSAYPELNRELTAFYRSDYNLKVFLDGLKSAGLYDEDTLVVLTADHCRPSAVTMNEFPGAEITPFGKIIFTLLSPRTLPPVRAEGGTSQLDVAPSLLHLLGLHIPNSYWGRSFFALDRPAAPFVGFFNSKIKIERDGQFETFNLDEPATETQESLRSLFNSYRRD